MYRYIALFWNSSSGLEQARAKRVMADIEAKMSGISCALKKDGTAIYAQSDDTAYLEINRTADLLILGKLFNKDFGPDSVPERTVLDETAAKAVCDSHGRNLVQKYWGRYVGFGYDAEIGSWFAVRDPTAELPCYMTVVGEMTVVFSNMEDCLRLQLQEFTLDWSHLAYSVQFSFQNGARSGFNEVTTVEAGEAITIKRGKPVARQCLWDIVTMAAEDPITDLDEAVRLARLTILGCISALASQHTDIELQLSGGLDSSIVLAGLLHARSGPNVRCIHHYSSGVGADERSFATMAAAGAGHSSGRSCELVEFKRTPDVAIEEMLTLPQTARPVHGLGYLVHRHAWQDGTLGGHVVHFTGGGGDGIFWRFKGNAAAIDYAWRYGVNRKLLRVAFETAQSGDSFYGVMRDAIRFGVFKKPARSKVGWVSPFEWLRPGHLEVTETQPAFVRHGLSTGVRLSPQKIRHVARMILPFSILDPFEGASNWHGVSPINSQPVIELFARMPLHLLMAGAEDRTIARRAFAGLLPQALLSRRVKSYMGDHAVAVIQRHREFIRTMLADGILAQHGFIDGAAADAAIRRLSANDETQILAILGPLLNIETWLRRWQRQSQGSA